MNKKFFCFVFAIFFVSGAFAEFNFLGGLSVGLFNDRVNFDGKKHIESSVPAALSFQFDYFLFPDYWFGVSLKTTFGGNIFQQYGVQDVWMYYIDTTTEALPHASLFFNISPNATFRYTFKNHRYIAGSVGVLYSVSHFNLPMVWKHDGQLEFYRKENTKNALGLNFEIFYKISKTRLIQGIFLNAYWLFLEWNSYLYDSATQIAGGFSISLGYQLGWSIPIPGQKPTAVQEAYFLKTQDVQKQALSKLENQQEAERKSRVEEQQKENELNKFLTSVKKSAKGVKSPIVILGCDSVVSPDGKVSVSIEFQNISDNPISAVEFVVVPLTRKGRQISMDSSDCTILINQPVAPNSEPVIIFKRNFFENEEIGSVTVKKVTIATLDGSKIVRTGLSKILLSGKQQNQLKKLREAVDSN